MRASPWPPVAAAAMAALLLVLGPAARAQADRPCTGVPFPDQGRVAASEPMPPQVPAFLERRSFIRSPDASSLFTLSTNRLRIAEFATSGTTVRVAAAIDAGKAPVVLAWTSQTRPPRPRADVAWLPTLPRGRDAAADLLALEYLYQAGLQLDPLARYTLQGALSAPGRARTVDHATALAAIAAVRNCVAADRHASDGGQPFSKWESVRIEAVPAPGGPLGVGVGVRDASSRPVVGAQVSFARGEHFTCSAATDARGVARCVMWDAHGHADATDEDARAPTVAVFGGKVSSGLTLLPTTFTWSDGTRRGRGAASARQ